MDLYKAAKEEVVAYKIANIHVNTTASKIAPLQTSWQKPAEGFYRVNWDAATNLAEGRIGIGVVARDFQGQVIGTLQAPRSMNEDSFSTEAYGFLLAAIFCKEMGLSKVILEGDALQVVTMANKVATNQSFGGLLIEDALSVLKALTSWSVVHTNRNANMAAHRLAKVGLDLDEDKYVMEEISQCIQSIVLSDLM